jgi:type II secretory pathway pseudopilin PulG
MSNVKRQTSNVPRGFTSLELFLVIAFIGLMAAMVSVPLSSLQTDSALKDAAVGLVEALRRAETQAMSGHYGDKWGVHLSTSDGCALPTTKYHLFRGEAFDSASDTVDTFDLPATVSITAVSVGGGCDVEFSRFHGSATTTGTVTLTGPNGTRTVDINRYGRIHFQ